MAVLGILPYVGLMAASLMRPVSGETSDQQAADMMYHNEEQRNIIVHQVDMVNTSGIDIILEGQSHQQASDMDALERENRLLVSGLDPSAVQNSSANSNCSCPDNHYAVVDPHSHDVHCYKCNDCKEGEEPVSNSQCDGCGTSDRQCKTCQKGTYSDRVGNDKCYNCTRLECLEGQKEAAQCTTKHDIICQTLPECKQPGYWLEDWDRQQCFKCTTCCPGQQTIRDCIYQGAPLGEACLFQQCPHRDGHEKKKMKIIISGSCATAVLCTLAVAIWYTRRKRPYSNVESGGSVDSDRKTSPPDSIIHQSNSCGDGEHVQGVGPGTDDNSAPPQGRIPHSASQVRLLEDVDDTHQPQSHEEGAVGGENDSDMRHRSEQDNLTFEVLESDECALMAGVERVIKASVDIVQPSEKIRRQDKNGKIIFSLPASESLTLRLLDSNNTEHDPDTYWYKWESMNPIADVQRPYASDWPKSTKDICLYIEDDTDSHFSIRAEIGSHTYRSVFDSVDITVIFEK